MKRYRIWVKEKETSDKPNYFVDTLAPTPDKAKEAINLYFERYGINHFVDQVCIITPDKFDYEKYRRRAE